MRSISFDYHSAFPEGVLERVGSEGLGHGRQGLLDESVLKDAFAKDAFRAHPAGSTWSSLRRLGY